MAREKESAIKHEFDLPIEQGIESIVMDSEFVTAESNMDLNNSDFEAYVDIFDAERPEKDYDWQSDISLPEFASQMLTMSAIDAAQYYQTRDFTDVYLEDEGDEALAQAAAAKECLNRTLNQKHLHWYQKYIRAKNISYLNSNVVIECWWEQDFKRGVVGIDREARELDVDVLGNKITDLSVQEPAVEITEEEVIGDIIDKDRFNCDVIDPRNVFMDNRYSYSLQEKDYVIIRSERTFNDLKLNALRGGFFNLDAVEEALSKNSVETETARESFNEKDDFQHPDKTPMKPLDVYKRYGKFWAVVEETNDDGFPAKVKPGIGVDGDPLDDAELIEMIITFAVVGGTRVLIGFNPTPYIDANGNPFRPIVRGLCYVHPTEDHGAGDGKYARELQKAIDDTFNLSNDRTMLATMPTLKGKKDALADNDSIFFEPNHLMEVEDPNDIQEFKLSDNTVGALNQINLLKGTMQQASSLSPSAQGQTPAFASTSATATASAEVRTDMRTNYKSMTFEHTALTEMYWMILQMTWRFASPESGFKLMGDKIFDFAPGQDFYYKPVTSTIESEHSKNVKVQRYTQLLATISGIQHPDMIKIVNDLVGRIYELMGDEYTNFANTLLNEETPIQGQGQDVAITGEAPSNQFGIPQSIPEQGARGAFNE
jgi:hypothetical protein